MVATSLPDGRIPVVLTAHAADLVAEDAAAILAHLGRRPEITAVADVAATVLRTRRIRRHRAVVRATDIAELTDGLRALAAGDEHPLVNRSSENSSGRTAFVFPGQGSQWPSMGAHAYDRIPEYRAEADACAARFVAAGAASPLSYLLAEDPSADYPQVQIQGAQFVHGVALARVWRSCGVLPDITVGHSLGEIGAAYVAGAIGLSDAVGVVIARATVLDGLTGPYRVAVLGVTPAQARAAIAETPGWLELSVVNSPTSVAVSGERDAISAIVETIADRGAFAREIEMWFPAHTTALDAVRGQLESLLPTGHFAETPVQFIGAATARVMTPGTDFADYWYANLRSTVRFDEAIRTAVGCGARSFVEMSAHPALLVAMGDLLDDSALMVGSGRRDEPLVDRLSANIVTTALADPGYRWADLLDGGMRKPLRDFPFAPMRAERHWATREPLPPLDVLTVAVEHWEPLPEAPSADDTPRATALLDLGAACGVGARLRGVLDGDARFRTCEPAEADLLVVVAPTLDEPDPVSVAGELCRRLEGGLLAYADSIGPGCRDVWLVTVGAENVVGGDPGPQPDQAAVRAMHRSIGFECPEQNFGHLDLPGTEFDDAVLATGLTAILGAADDVAVREGPVTYGRTMRNDVAPGRSWAPDSGVYDDVVITGGSGNIGLHFARHLAGLGARRIVLLSRGGVDAAVLAGLSESTGTEILAPRCDVTDVDELRATAAQLAGAGASLVIHAAGAAHIEDRHEVTVSSALATFSAKVVGFHHLVEAWPMRPDVRIVLCSSLSGVWGGRGHVVYSAANRLLDVMAGQQRRSGRHCTSVRWGLWQGNGIFDADETLRVERSGLRAMEPGRAIEAALRDHTGDPLVFCADPDRLRSFLGAHVPAEPAAEAPAPETSRTDAADAVRAALQSVLKVADATGLDLDESLLDLGVDSLLALDLRKRLKKSTGHNVPLATILGGVTGIALIEQLNVQDREQLSRD